MTFRIMPYEGWDIGEIIVDGVAVKPNGSYTYTFTNVSENHSIYVSAVKIQEETAPFSQESVAKLIDHLLNDTPIDNTYDFDKNGVIDGRDLIVLQQAIASL